MNNAYVKAAAEKADVIPAEMLSSAAAVMEQLEADMRMEGLWTLPVTGDNLEKSIVNALAFIGAQALACSSNPLEAIVAALAIKRKVETTGMRWCLAKEIFADDDPFWFLLCTDFPPAIEEEIKAGKYATIGDLYQASPWAFMS